MALIWSFERSCFMEEKIVLNERLMSWLFGIIKDMLESTIEDNPSRINTIIAVNNFIEQLDFDMEDIGMSELVGEKITNKMFDEIKSNI